MGVAFIPSGRIVNNPDSVKLVQVRVSEVYGKMNYVVSIKLDDDAELLVKSLTNEAEAYALAEICIKHINAAAEDEFLYGDEDTGSDDDGDDAANADADDADDAADAADADDDDDWDDDSW